MKQLSEGVKFHLSSGKECPRPAMEKEQICENLYQLFCSVLRNWQDCKEEKVSTAAFSAWDGSVHIYVGSSVCAQQVESKGVKRRSGLALQRALNWLCAQGWISCQGPAACHSIVVGRAGDEGVGKNCLPSRASSSPAGHRDIRKVKRKPSL